jgi:hypothetical protein
MRKKITLSIGIFVFLCASFITAAASTTVNFEVTQVTINEESSEFVVIRRTGDLDELTTVVLTTVAGTATNEDFVIGPTTTVTFAPGVSEVQREVNGRNDDFYEGTEWFSVLLRSASPDVRVGPQRLLTVSINDDADFPSVTFNTNYILSRVEPGAGRQVAASVSIRLSPQSTLPVTVTLTTTDDTATAGIDYSPVNSTLTFAPMEDEKDVSLSILGDGANESREAFNLNLLNPVNAQVPIPERSFTIINSAPYLQQIDFDGNGVADFAGYASDTGFWFLGQYGETPLHPDVMDYTLVPGDYTGDGQTDVGLWRPSTGDWYVIRSEDSSYYAVHFGTAGDIPVPADFDADGVADLAVFRPSTGTWYVQRSSDGATDVVQFGANGDRPAPADFDGDWKADIAVYRPGSTEGSQWWIKRSSDGLVSVTSFGVASDRTVAADYTGDGKADIAVWRPSNGQWFIQRSEDSSYYLGPYGSYTGTSPAPGDYNGDGRADYGLLDTFGHSLWSVRSGTSAPWIGIGGVVADPTVKVPLASVNVH